MNNISKKQQLLKEYRIALDNESSATKTLEASLKNGTTDESVLEVQTKQIIDNHAKSMDIYEQLVSTAPKNEVITE